MLLVELFSDVYHSRHIESGSHARLLEVPQRLYSTVESFSGCVDIHHVFQPFSFAIVYSSLFRRGSQASLFADVFLLAGSPQEPSAHGSQPRCP